MTPQRLPVLASALDLVGLTQAADTVRSIAEWGDHSQYIGWLLVMEQHVHSWARSALSPECGNALADIGFYAQA